MTDNATAQAARTHAGNNLESVVAKIMNLLLNEQNIFIIEGKRKELEPWQGVGPIFSIYFHFIACLNRAIPGLFLKSDYAYNFVTETLHERQISRYTLTHL